MGAGWARAGAGAWRRWRREWLGAQRRGRSSWAQVGLRLAPERSGGDSMSRQAQAVILLLVGGAVLRASLTDQYLNYVKPGLQPYLILAGVILVVAGLFSLWYEVRP